MAGWICLHRSIIDWEWYGDANTMRLFIHCLIKANHKSKVWRGIEIHRGSFYTSLDTLSSELSLSVRQIRTSFDKLSLTGEVTSSGMARGRMVTIFNYDHYQSDDKLSVNEKAGSRQARDRLVTTTNNDNKENNENKKGLGQQVDLEDAIKDSPKPKKKKFSSSIENYQAWGFPDKPSVEIFDAWIDMRRSKKHTMSDLSFKGIGAGLTKSKALGFTVDQCLTKAESRGWAGLDADWMTNSSSRQSFQNKTAATKPQSKNLLDMVRSEK